MLTSIRNKILLTQISVAVFIGLSIGAVSYYFMLSTLKATQQSEMEHISKDALHGVFDYLKDTSAVIENIARSGEFESYTRSSRDIPLAAHFAKFQDTVPYLSYIGNNGKEEVKTIDGESTDNLMDYSADHCVVNSLSTPNKVVISTMKKIGLHYESIITFTLAKFNYAGDTFSGILMGHVPLNRFVAETIAHIRVGKTGYVSLIDNNGTVLYHPQEGTFATSITGDGEIAEALITNAKALRHGFARATVLGTDSLIAYAPVKELNWSILVIMPYKEFISIPIQLRNTVLALVAAIVLLLIIISLKSSSRITDPLVKLASFSKLVARGNFSQKVEVASKDSEINTLVNSFNQMTENLSATLISKDYIENIFTSMTDSMVIIDSAGYIRSVNNATLRLLGYSKKDLIGKHAGILFGNETGAKVFHDIHATLVDAQYINNVEVVYETGKRVKIPVSISCSIITDLAGTGYDLVFAGKDISELRRTQHELESMVLKLRESNRELEDFAHIASHDLQEPLRKIIAFSDRLKNAYADSIDEKGRDYIERMCNAASRMQNLIDGLLMYSRITTRAKAFVPIDLSHVAKEVVSDLEVPIDEKKGRVDIDTLPTVKADPLQMQLLFQNLIGNALKFHKKGEAPLVKISSTIIHGNGNNPNMQDMDDEVCQLTFTDNGIGFDEQYTDRIFGVFQRLHGKKEYAGTGIGLSICRRIVDKHNGKIIARSSPGSGATFIVTIPVNQISGGNNGHENSVNYHTHG